MHGIWLTDSHLEFSRHLPEPTPAAGEVLVDVLAAGICETDLQLKRGYMGFEGILGHEFVGIPRAGRFAGQRVVGEINCGCGTCSYCQAGWSRHCPHRTVLGILGRNGAFAQTLALPERNLLPVPNVVSTSEAVWTEPLAAAYRIPEQLALTPGTPTLILGDGRLGNLCAQVLALQGCQVEIVGKHPLKLGNLSRLGLSTRLLANLDPARKFPLVIDCTGSSTGLKTALSAVAPQGTVVLKTTVAGPHHLLMAPVVVDEVRIIGSRCGPFIPALQALADRQIQLQGLVESVVPLHEVPMAIERASQEPVFKILVDIGGCL